MAALGSVRTGTAGWVFEPWRGTFFPQGLVQKKELAYASSLLGSIEINATFRANQKPDSFRKWAGETPEGFVFSIKGPQLVTHIKRLKNSQTELANFFASGVLALGQKLGPIIWQLPPNLSFDPEVLESFLSQLPRTPQQCVELAEKSDSRLKSEPFLQADNVPPLRHAIEMRNTSFDVPEATALLERYNIARVIADTAKNPARTLTADFAYCRLQGPAHNNAQNYGADDIADWAATCKGWSEAGHDVFAYFVHEDKLHAPANAIALRKAMGISYPAD